MNCKKPFFPGGLQSFPCGQCLPCRINRNRLWAHRLLLEGKCHGQSTVATLTYSNDFGPVSDSLRPDQLQRWLKRLREAIKPRKLRFYLCGEYGEQYERPHYHVILYGLDPLIDAEAIRQSWGLGHVHLDSLTYESAAYICRYVTKKLTSPDDPRLQGRHPEFARMSRRPGIAADLMGSLALQCADQHTAAAIGRSMDVPTVLQHGKRRLPLGRYLRQRLRQELLGRSPLDCGQPQELMEKKARELRALSEVVGVAKAVETLKLQSEPQRVRNTEARFRVHQPRKSF